MNTPHSSVAVSRIAKPVLSQNSKEAKKRVLNIYKKLQREAKRYWWDFELWDIPVPVFREVLKNQFIKNSHITDVRIIDRKVEECRQHMAISYNYIIPFLKISGSYTLDYFMLELPFRFYFYNEYHVRNMLFAENIEPKPKDFLAKFLQGKE